MTLTVMVMFLPKMAETRVLNAGLDSCRRTQARESMSIVATLTS